MKTCSVLVTYSDYSDLDWRVKQAKSHSRVLFVLIRKTTHIIIDYFMLKETSGGRHVPLSSPRQEQSH